MIRKLRIKFIAVNMCLVFLMMITLFASVYVIMNVISGERCDTVLDETEDLIRSGEFFRRRASGEQKTDESEFTIIETQENDGDPLMLERVKISKDYANRSEEAFRRQMINQTVVIFYDRNEKIIAVDSPTEEEQFNEFIGQDLSDLFSKKENKFLAINGIPYRFRDVRIDKYSAVVCVNFLGEMKGLDNLFTTMLIIGIVSLIIILAFSIVISGRIIRPIKDAWDKQKTFVADASHELKTPLSVISANMDVIRSNPEDTVKSQEKWFGYVDAEISDMQKLVEDMLSLAKYDSGEKEVQLFSNINFSDIVTEAGLVSESRAIESDLEITLDVDEDIYINADPKKIKQVAMILIDNAIKNTQKGGNIHLSLHKSHNDAVLVCKNTGYGIPKDEIKYVFDRFYRTDRSRARASGGNGLGLSIAKSITESYSGKIYAESEPRLYTKFTVRIPVSKKG